MFGKDLWPHFLDKFVITINVLKFTPEWVLILSEGSSPISCFNQNTKFECQKRYKNGRAGVVLACPTEDIGIHSGFT